MKILLTGASGRLGSECKDALKSDYEIIAPDKEELDITSWDKVITSISQLSPDIILNCAAFTKVDECETELMWRAPGTWHKGRPDMIRLLFTYLPILYLMAERDYHSPILKMIPWIPSLFTV